MNIEHFIFNPFQEHCCVVSDETGFCAFVDPGCYNQEELSQITDYVTGRGLTPVCIMLTHAHFDHIYGMAALAKEYGIPVYAHREEMFTITATNPQVCAAYGLELPDTFPMLKNFSDAHLPSRFEWAGEGEVIEVGKLRFEVFETPGHSRGGLCFYERTEGVLFSGDTLFAGAIGRTDHPGGDYDSLMKSIFEKLMVLDGQVAVIPGHGPETDIATERNTNPFLMPFNEPFEDEE